MDQAIGNRARPRSRSPARNRAINFNLQSRQLNELELAVAQIIDAGAKHIKVLVKTVQEFPPPSGKLVAEINDKSIVCWYENPLRSAHGAILFDVIASIVTRWGCYRTAASPVYTDRNLNETIGVFSCTNLPRVAPMQCEPWFSKARVKELEPKASELQALREQIQRMHDLVGEPNCFLANTAFRKPDGTFQAVQDVAVGDTLRLANGEVTHVTHATRLRQLVQDLVELVTNQASLRVSAKHRIVTTMGVRMAQDLARNDEVLVGDRMRPLANVRSFQEGVELFDIRFDPDAPIEAFVIPNYGIQVLGAAPPLMEVFRNIPAEELMRAMPAEYKD